MEIKRGDIRYIESGFPTTGSEQRAGRPAVIVSNDINNKNSATVEVVYLTTQPKRDLLTHTVVRGTGQRSTALCEQITTVSTERIGDYCGRVTDDEMSRIDDAIMISLGLSPDGECEPSHTLTAQLAEAQTRCAILQEMYDTLLNRLVKAN